MSTADEMACVELVEVVTAYLEDAVPGRDRGRFEAHLAECPYCVEYVEQFRATVEAIGSLTVESIPAERRAELLEAFRGWHDKGI